MKFVLAILLLAPLTLAQHPCGQTPIQPDLGTPFQDEEMKRLEKVVGGRPAVPGSWPWQISLRLNGGTFHTCGGVIICRNVILTAAHCIWNNRDRPSLYKVDTGRYYKDQWTQEIVTHDVVRIVANMQYNPFRIDNDIALLQISPPINYDNYRQPACLPSRDGQPGEIARITGWGQTMGTGWDGILKQAAVPILTNQACSATMGSMVSENMICIGYPDGSHGGCMGDSGGPLVVRENNAWMLVGLVSWGRRACNAHTVFARVRNYMVNDWIRTNVNSLGGCQ